ncbi:MAG: oxidoreductase [Leptothrix sp. (in: b-proteobacteria)]
MPKPVSQFLVTTPPVWFITGCSNGVGLELARQSIERGQRTEMTARDPSRLQGHAATDHAQVLPLDVTQPAQVVAAIRAAEARFGGIDVLVNNAGIGCFGAIEEGEEADVRQMFEVNVFEPTRMIQGVLSGMRQRRSGCIVNLSSLAGVRGMPALGQCCASKFAVEGLSEALRQEVEPLGIHVMGVEPSGFRTDWAGRSASESAHPIDDHMASAGQVRQAIRASSGHPPGDPVRAARAILDAVATGHPPHHLLLGNDAFEGAIRELDELRRDFHAGEAVARGADFPKVSKARPAARV